MTRLSGVVFAAGLAALSACAQPTDALSGRTAHPPASAAQRMSTVIPGRATAVPLPLMRVHKSASCGCCTTWVEHMRKAGFSVEVHNADNLEPIKQRLDVPYGKGSCHTAEIAGLVIEGHVPAADIKRLLKSRGQARGLVLPGMPAGSPGMEMPDGRIERYTVEQVNADGSTSPFSTHGASPRGR